MSETAVLRRRLERLRAARLSETVDESIIAIREAIEARAGSGGALAETEPVGSGRRRSSADELAARLAEAIGGETIRTPTGRYVRQERPPVSLPVDRIALARLPGQPPAEVPLVCLDVETTGLGTAAGTTAFLVGLGWWEGPRYRQLELLLPDQSEESALLSALAAMIPPTAWLVTYNGRSFDWPLLETRYRLGGRAAPLHGGHLDLLPVVRRLFRHRLPDARLQTVERYLLGIARHGDLPGWEIPGHYLAFLRGGPAGPLGEIVRHNHEDVRSLARLVVHLADRLGDPAARAAAPAGDLLGLARAYRRHGRALEALACLDLAVEGGASAVLTAGTAWGTDALPWGALAWAPHSAAAPRSAAEPGWAGALLSRGQDATAAARRQDVEIAIHIERARLLRVLGRHDDAADSWRAVAAGRGPAAVRAWIELAKDREHRHRDAATALAATDRALALRRGSWLSAPAWPGIDRAIEHRRRRLLRKLSGIQPAPG